MADDDSFDAYRVTDPSEVRVLLRALMDQAVTVNLSASDGTAYAARLWSLDAAHDHLMFTADVMDPQVHRLVEADEASAVAYLDKVKVQFDVAHLMLVQGHHASVLQAHVPRELFRFQRRNGFRVRTIERTQPTATFRHPAIPDMTLALRVLDVSIGGCALLLPRNVPDLVPGTVLPGVRLALDGETSLEAQVLLHHVTSTGSESGSVRLGCELVGLSGTAQRGLQRYIDQTQKRRRMMALE